MEIKSYKDLEIWQLSEKLIVKVYRLLTTFPKEEKFGIVAQAKDSVISTAGNIAEGFGRFYFKDKIVFYYHSRASLFETESHLLTSEKLGFINESNCKLYQEILGDIQNLGVKINNYISTLWKTAKQQNNQLNKQLNHH
ncbi:MAG: four helix bundle protein [Patescibacteria group bacterium]